MMSLLAVYRQHKVFYPEIYEQFFLHFSRHQQQIRSKNSLSAVHLMNILDNYLSFSPITSDNSSILITLNTHLVKQLQKHPASPLPPQKLLIFLTQLASHYRLKKHHRGDKGLLTHL